MAKPTLRELKAKGHKAPLLSWVLDRALIYLLIALLPLLALSYLVKDSIATVRRIEAPYTPKSPYKAIAAVNTPGEAWVGNFLTTKPPMNTVWTITKNDAPQQPVDFKTCNAFGLLPPTAFKSGSAQGDQVNVDVQIYAPGEAKGAFENYKKLYATCWPVASVTAGAPSTELAQHTKGFFFTYGDAIIFVETNQLIDYQAAISYFTAQAAKTLTDSSCTNLTVASTDTQRSPYLNAQAYRGFFKDEVVKTKLSVDGLPTPVFQESKELPTMEVPEGPLSPKILKLPAKSISRPALPTSPNNDRSSLEKKISYQIPDPIGPGCGWSWSGQKAPVVNEEQLSSKQQQLTENAQITVDNNAQKFLTAVRFYNIISIMVQKDLDQWNSYVLAVQKVHQNWAWLNDERAKVEPAWEVYVDAHNYWASFDSLKAEKVKAYQVEVNACNSANQEAARWESTWRAKFEAQEQAKIAYQEALVTYENDLRDYQAQQQLRDAAKATTTPTPTPTESMGPDGLPTLVAPTPTPTPTESETPLEAPTPPTAPVLEEIPVKPAGCSATPLQPAILTQEKGAEPEPPVLPEGVTIPQSWPKPE